MSDREKQADELKAAIAGLEAQRPLLGDAVVEPALAALRQRLRELTASAAPSGPAEERKIVTILFVDVSGFTALSEKLDAEDVRKLINNCFECLVPIVQKYEGTIDKFIGDEIMALFGAPVAHENDPERALRTALEMMASISSFNREHGTELGLHIGINTGPVVTGAIGSQHRSDYSVMGDAVNLAARLEGASADGEIYVGPSTYRQTATIFDFLTLPPMELKGKAQPVKIYRLLGLKAVPRSGRGIEGLQAELVGRSGEMERLQTAFEGLRQGQGGVLSVVGEAGLGKSRLIAEAMRSFAADISSAEGRALSHTTAMSYWVARGILRALLGCDENASSSRIDQALHSSIEAVAPDAIDKIYPYLARLLDLQMPETVEERVRYLTSEALHGRILHAFQDYVRARTERGPLILFWEDLHWCDPSSLRILETILPVTMTAPLLLILAYRPDEETVNQLQNRAQSLSRDKALVLKLSPLTRKESGSLVHDLLKIDNLPEKMHDLILSRAEGNPFFVEELLRSLLDAGALVRQDDRVIATADIESVSVPETLQGVLAARMDRLAAEKKQALQSAAVIGRVFQQRVLAHMQNGQSHSNGDLSEALLELQRREFIQRRAQTKHEEREYIFKHAVTQDVAYHTLLVARRKQLHREVGEALEAIFPERLTELSSTLAYHFQNAEAREKAFHYLRLAGENAQAAFANSEAIGYYESAIAQAKALLANADDAGTIAALARIHESLGDVLKLAGRHEQTREAYAAALGLLVGKDRVGRSRLQRKIASSYSVQRQYENTGGALDAAEAELGEESPDSTPTWWDEKIQVQLERMHLLYWQGMSKEMLELAEQIRTRVEEKATPLLRSQFFQMLALSQLTGSRFNPSEEAVRLAQLAVSTSEGSDDLSEIPHIRFVLGLIQLFRGHVKHAIETFGIALQLGERSGDLVVQARCLTYLAVAHRRSDHIEEARRYGKRTLEIVERIGMVEYIAMARANLAWVAWREGNMDGATSLGEEALRLWHGMEDPYSFDWMALLPLIAVSAEKGRIEDAIQYARDLFRESQHPLPEKLSGAARDLIAAADQPLAVRPALDQLIKTAREIGYL